MKESRFFLGINFAMAGVFIVSSALQYNDPDPIQWTVIYGLAALACFFRNKIPKTVFRVSVSVLVIIVVVWIIALLPEVISVVEPADLLSPMNPDKPEIEVGREAGGLLIVLMWMGVLLARTRKLASSL